MKSFLVASRGWRTRIMVEAAQTATCRALIAIAFLLVIASFQSGCGGAPLVADPPSQSSSSKSTGSCLYCDVSGVFDPLQIGGVRLADAFMGTDACAKIAAAIATLPSTGGVVDARGFEGTQPCASNPLA